MQHISEVTPKFRQFDELLLYLGHWWSNKLTCAWTRWGSMCSWNIGNTAVIISSCDIKEPTLLLSRWTREIRWEWTPPTCFQATNYFQDSSSNKELVQFKPRKWIIWFIARCIILTTAIHRSSDLRMSGCKA